ncbi:MAG: hypothetical protein ACFE8N_07920 [Promethearchaeota archaeon]
MMFFILPISFGLERFETQAKIPNYQINVNAAHVNYTMTIGHPFTWINISSGTELGLGDDDYADTFLPFNFSFYDGEYDEITITSEGYITFSYKSVLTSGAIPSSHPHRQNIIAPFWTNLDGTSGNIYVKNFSTYWVVAWENFNHYNGSFAGTFETILYNNGNIIFNYKSLSNVSSYACGLNYGDGNNYSSYNQLTSDLNDFSIKFSPVTSSGNGGNGGIDNNAINIIVGITVPVGIISIIGGTALFFYRKNPEQFKSKLSSAKAKLRKSTEKVATNIKSGSAKIKEQVEKKVKTKKAKKET